MSDRNKNKKAHALAAAKTTDLKITQVALHLEYLFDRGVNFRDRIITLRGEIDEPMFDIVDSALSEMEHHSKSTVTIRIFSEGGSVYEALAIVGRIRRSKCHVVTEGYGCIMSAATLIFSCGHKRIMSEFCQFMHHEASYETGGRHTQIKATVEQMEKEEKLWAKWMARFSDKNEDFWYDFAQHTDKYFTAEECLELGVSDEILIG